MVTNADDLLAYKINEIIDVFDIVFESLRRKEDRLKTLENKVKFNMENTYSREGGNTVQDLWDEENKGKNILSEREQAILDKTFGKPTVYAPGVSGKPTDKSEKIEEIIEEFEERFISKHYPFLGGQHNYWLEKDDMKNISKIESWLRDRLKWL